MRRRSIPRRLANLRRLVKRGVSFRREQPRMHFFRPITGLFLDSDGFLPVARAYFSGPASTTGNSRGRSPRTASRIDEQSLAFSLRRERHVTRRSP